MPKHDVYATLPNALMDKEDALFSIYRDGKKLDILTISKGTIEWYPKNTKLPYSLPWTQFDKMIKEAHDEV